MSQEKLRSLLAVLFFLATATPARSQGVAVRLGSGETVEYLTGNPLREFRRLAVRLIDEGRRLVTVAELSRTSDDDSARLLVELQNFSQRAADLSRDASGDALNPRTMGRVLTQLMDDVRRNECELREANVAPSVDWTSSIDLLTQMATIVHQP